MFMLVSGGAGSGKSEYAESMAVKSGCKQLVYVATMQVWDDEDRQRVKRHQKLREGKGFFSIEAPTDVGQITLPEGCCVLLEDLSNLCANECFGPQGFAGATDRIIQGISRLQEKADTMIVVTNELFSDGVTYQEETETYLSLLAMINSALAGRADSVIEVVCGIPVSWKGEGF